MATGRADWTSKADVNVTNASITITGTVTATVTGSVSITGTPSVSITGTPTVNIGTTGTISINQTGTANTIQVSGVSAANTALYTAGFLTPRTNQTPITAYASLTSGEWTTVYTVTNGKTFYISQASFSNYDTTNSQNMSLGHSAAADFAVRVLKDSSGVITFATPIKYTSTTVIQCYIGGASHGALSLVGWEE